MTKITIDDIYDIVNSDDIQDNPFETTELRDEITSLYEKCVRFSISYEDEDEFRSDLIGFASDIQRNSFRAGFKAAVQFMKECEI